MKIKSKKGSYIMEAAIVFPVVILVTVTVVLVIMFFYSQMAQRSQLHIILRSEAGMMTGKTVYYHARTLADETEAELYRRKSAFGGSVYGKQYLIMPNKGILGSKGTFVAEGFWHATDGVEYVRYCNLEKGVRNDAGE